MTTDRALIEAALERAEKASPAPWKKDTVQNVGENWLVGSVINCGDGETEAGYSQFIVTTDNVRASQCISGGAEEDADFIACARQDVPELARIATDALDEVVQLKQDVEKFRFAADSTGLDEPACAAIRELLNEFNVPVAAFIDDHVRNAIIQRDHSEARAERLAAVVRLVQRGSHIDTFPTNRALDALEDGDL